MRPFYKLTILLILIMLLTGSLIQAQAKLTLPESSFDFGNVPQHSTISHDFWIHSTGIDTLKITEVRPGCGCTKAPLGNKILAPGDSALLEIIYSTKNYRNKQAKRPRIYSNAGKGTDIVLFEAFVIRQPDSTFPVIISPFGIDATQYTKAKKKKFDFQISNSSELELKLNLINFPKDIFKIKLPKKLKPGEIKQCRLEIKKEFLAIDLYKSFTIDFTNKKGETFRFTIPVKRNVSFTNN